MNCSFKYNSSLSILGFLEREALKLRLSIDDCSDWIVVGFAQDSESLLNPTYLAQDS